MTEISNSLDERLDPIFVSVKQAAQLLAISPWSCYQLLDEKKIESRYQGRRRLVVMDSLRKYAAALPTREQRDAEASA